MNLPRLQDEDGGPIDIAQSFRNPDNFLDRNLPGRVTIAKEDQFSAILGFVWAVIQNKSIYIGNPVSEDSLIFLDQLEESRLKRGASPLVWFSSSGSTGVPKLIGHQIKNLTRSAKKIADSLPDVEGKVFPTFFPAHYMAGVLNTVLVPWVSGGCSVVTDSFGPMTPRLIKNLSRSTSGAVSWVSPTMLRALLATKSTHQILSSWSRILVATGPFSEKDWLEARNVTNKPVTNTYGSTEQLFISMNRNDDAWEGIGLPLPGVAFTTPPNFSHESENPVFIQTDTPAELFVPAGSGEAFLLPNPLETEDLVQIRSDGGFDLTGRRDDVVSLGGVNTNLTEYEGIVSTVPGVTATLAAVENFLSPKSIVVVIEVDNEADPEVVEQEVWQALFAEFPPDALPGRLKRMPIPRLPNGKVARNFRQSFLKK